MSTDEMREKWRGRVTFCKLHTDKLDDWSIGFIDSIDKQLGESRDLTIKQSFKLGEIYHTLEDNL